MPQRRVRLVGLGAAEEALFQQKRERRDEHVVRGLPLPLPVPARTLVVVAVEVEAAEMCPGTTSYDIGPSPISWYYFKILDSDSRISTMIHL